MTPFSPAPEDLLAKAATFIALSTVGAKWFVIVQFGGFSLEAANIGGLLVIFIGFIYILLYRSFRSNEIFNMLLILQFILLATFSLYGQSTGIVVMSIANTLVAYSLAMVGTLRSKSIIFYSFLGLLLFFTASIFISGVDFIKGFLEYLQTFNRDKFNFWVMRPIFNAFSSDSAEEYTTQINNSLSAAFGIFYVIAGSYGVCGDRRMAIVALLSSIPILVIFSSSAMLAAGIMSIVFSIFLIRNVRNVWVFYFLLLAAIGLFFVMSMGVIDYFNQNLISDTASREGRLLQYTEALAVIDKNMLLGAGKIDAHGHSVHNFFLFSFAAIGVLGGLLSFLIFALAGSMFAYGIYYGLFLRNAQPQMLMLVGLPVIFIVRSLFGGAGGLPSGPGVLALGLAVIAIREVRETQSFPGMGSSDVRLGAPLGRAG